MNEKTLTSGLVETLRKGLPGAVVFNHADRVTAGIPDISVTWNGCRPWLEVKYANPDFEVKGIQKLTMQRLAAQGLAWFVIYESKLFEEPRVIPGNHTFIVHPQYVVAGRKGILKLPSGFPFANGFDHQSVVDFLRRVQSEAQAQASTCCP